MGGYVLGMELESTAVRAVLMDGYRNIRACAAAPVETARVRQDPEQAVGPAIAAAVSQLLAELAASPAEITHAVLVSDHCLFALEQRYDLARVAVIRIGAPAGTGVPPLLDWPDDLRAAVQGSVHELSGGFELDGRTIGRPPDEQAVADLIAQLRQQRVEAAAITGIFSPVHPEQELALAAALQEAFGAGFPVVLSHWLGTVGLLERENGTVLNAALVRVGPRAHRLAAAVFARLGITAPVFTAQNDGTLMSAGLASRFPILTARCGVGHGLRGAAHLSGETDCAVLLCSEAGIEVGMLQDGFPRAAGTARALTGVRTGIPQPETISVRAPLAAGQPLDSGLIERVELALDRVRGRPEPVPVVCAGPLAGCLPDRLRGATRLIRPALGPYAAAVGAAMAPVGGRSDLIYSLEQWTRDGAEADAVRRAREQAVAAGADPRRLTVSRLEAAVLAYLSDSALRVTVRMVGPPAAMPSKG